MGSMKYFGRNFTNLPDFDMDLTGSSINAPLADLMTKNMPLLNSRFSKSVGIDLLAGVFEVSTGEIRELIEMGVFEVDKKALKRGRILFTKATLDKAVLDEWVPKPNLSEYILPEDYKSKPIVTEFLIMEIGRFDPRFENGLDLIEISTRGKSLDNDGKIVPMKAYAKRQLDQRLAEIGKKTLNRVRWGIELIVASVEKQNLFSADQETIEELQKSIDEGRNLPRTREEIERLMNQDIALYKIMDTFELEYNKRELDRFLGYSRLGYLELKNIGIGPQILDKYEFEGLIRKRMSKFLDLLYQKFYSGDVEYQHMRISGKRDLPNIAEGIIYATRIKDSIDFIDKKTVSQKDFAGLLFMDCADYFIEQLDEMTLKEVLEKEARFYSKEPIDFYKPITFRDYVRYHPTDILDFLGLLLKAGIYDDMTKGAKMKLAVREYTRKGTLEGMITAEELAEKLNTTPEKARILDIKREDVGFVKEFAELFKINYEEAERFYLLFKDKVEGFTDEEVRDYRVAFASFEEFRKQSFPAPIINTFKANEELKRQYEEDNRKGFYFPAHLAPFQLDHDEGTSEEGIWLNTLENNEETAKLMRRDDELRKRIEWSTKLREFYENPDAFSDYVRVDELKDILGVSEEEWQRLKPRVRTENPALQKIGERGKKKNGRNGFLSPTEFDDRYFKDEFKEYISKKYSKEYVNKFYQSKKVAELLTGIDSSLDTLVEESEKLGLDIQERLKPYMLDAEDKKGEFYLKYEITELKDVLSRNRSLRKLKIALGLSAKIDEARDKAGSKHETIEEAAKRLGISREKLKEYVRQGHLQSGGIGIVSALTSLINNSYGMSIGDNEIINFCRKDERYKDVSKTHGILNLDKFIRDSYTIDEARKEVTGDGWLAEAVFEHCKKNIGLTYLTVDREKRLHESDVQKIRYGMGRMGLTHIRKAISNRLQVKKLNGYEQDFVTRHVNKAQIESITAKVDKFAEECVDIAGIEAKIGVKFYDNAITSLMEQLSPKIQSFLGGKYHISDVEKLEGAITGAADKLDIPAQTATQFASKGYMTLSENGLSNEGLAELVRFSYSLDNIADISRTLSQREDINQYFFKHNDSRLCPSRVLAEYVQDHHIPDITEKGMMMLANNKAWHNYLIQELNGNNDMERIGARIIKYLMADSNIVPKNGGYSGEDFDELETYMRLLAENNVHGIASFKRVWKRGGYTIDPDSSYYTRTELIRMTKLNAGELDKICKDNDIDYLGSELMPADRDHNDMWLYKLRDVATVLKQIGDRRLNNLPEPIDVVIMHGVINACQKLGISEDSESFLAKIGPEIFRKFAYSLKIGDNTRDVKDSMPYERMSSAFYIINRSNIS